MSRRHEVIIVHEPERALEPTRVVKRKKHPAPKKPRDRAAESAGLVPENTYDLIARSVLTATSTGDTQSLERILTETKPEILAAVAAKADASKAALEVMEEVVKHAAEFERRIHGIVKSSGYSEIIRQSLEHGLRDDLIRAIKESLTPNAKTKLSFAARVENRFNQSVSNKMEALKETVGEPADSDAVLIDIRTARDRLHVLESKLQGTPQEKAAVIERANVIDGEIQSLAETWVAAYASEHPTATANDIFTQTKDNGFDDFISKKDVERIIGDEARATDTDAKRTDGTKSIVRKKREEVTHDDRSRESRRPRNVELPTEHIGASEVQNPIDAATTRIRNEIARLDAMTDPKEQNALDRNIQRLAAEWANDYRAANPSATANDVMARANSEGIDGFLTIHDVEALMRGTSVDDLYQSDSTRVRDTERTARPLVAKPDQTTYGSDAWIAGARNALDGEIRGEASRLEEKKPVGFMQRLSQSGFGKWLRRGLLLTLGLSGGIKAGMELNRGDETPRREETHQAPSTDVSAPEGVVATDDAGVTIEQNNFRVAKTTRPAVAERSIKTDSSRNLERALTTIDATELPSKTEWLSMKQAERTAALKENLAAFRTIRDAMSAKSPAVEAMQSLDHEAMNAKLANMRGALQILKDAETEAARAAGTERAKAMKEGLGAFKERRAMWAEVDAALKSMETE